MPVSVYVFRAFFFFKQYGSCYTIEKRKMEKKFKLEAFSRGYHGCHNNWVWIRFRGVCVWGGGGRVPNQFIRWSRRVRLDDVRPPPVLAGVQRIYIVSFAPCLCTRGLIMKGPWCKLTWVQYSTGLARVKIFSSICWFVKFVFFPRYFTCIFLCLVLVVLGNDEYMTHNDNEFLSVTSEPVIHL